MSKKKTAEIELILLPKKNPPKKLNLQCIRCDKKLEIDNHGGFNAHVFPNVYYGVVLRSSGQYGSTVLDCGVGIPSGYHDEIQIIICDECIIKLGNRINMWTQPRDVITRHTDKLNKGLQRSTKWSDYVTYNDDQNALKKNNKAIKKRQSPVRKNQPE
jgi:transcription elongation factor Elf1